MIVRFSCPGQWPWRAAGDHLYYDASGHINASLGGHICACVGTHYHNISYASIQSEWPHNKEGENEDRNDGLESSVNAAGGV